MNIKTYEIVEDALPYDQGGFRSGVQFFFIDVEYMRRKRTITPGTLLKSDGEMYEIKEKHNGYYDLVKLEE